jgi:inosine-uridine nucleoside N-ribohydrolase
VKRLMAQKAILVADPGIDGAFAIALALHDPALEVIGLAATGGNVTGEQATRNVQILVEQIDPPRWPRLGSALALEFDVDGRQIHGPLGLGAESFPCAQLHHTLASDKLLVDLVRQYPKEVTVVVMGPLTVVARALDRDVEFSSLVQRIICMGGAWREAGNASAAAEFHFYCDPLSARQVLKSGVPLTLIPLDISRQILFSPKDLLELPSAESRTCRFLRRIVPYGIGATSNAYGIEGFHLEDVVGVFGLSRPDGLTTRPATVDVETRGDLTRGMSVVDSRPGIREESNVDLAVGVDVTLVRKYMDSVLNLTGATS